MSKWNLRNTLTALSYSKIKAVYKDYEGRIVKGSYGTDAVGVSRYISEQCDRVSFVTFNGTCHTSFSVFPEEIKLKINDQMIDLSSLKNDPDAYFSVHALIEQAKKQNVHPAGVIKS